MASKKCILDESKICDECGECDYCDLNPFKLCDNCGKCIDDQEEYRELKIDDVMINGKSKSEKLKTANHHDCCCHHEDKE